MRVVYILRNEIGVLFAEEGENPFVPLSGDVVSNNGKVYEVSHRHKVGLKDEVEVFVDPAKPKTQ